VPNGYLIGQIIESNGHPCPPITGVLFRRCSIIAVKWVLNGF